MKSTQDKPLSDNDFSVKPEPAVSKFMANSRVPSIKADISDKPLVVSTVLDNDGHSVHSGPKNRLYKKKYQTKYLRECCRHAYKTA